MRSGSKICYMAMILVQLVYGASNILIKVSIDRGINQFVFVVYRHLIAMVLLAPFAYMLERKKRPHLSLSIVTKIFVLSSFGTTIHLNVYYAGLFYTSPTVAGALSNVVPSLTFVLALLLRMEKLKIRSARGQAKVAGSLLCLAGSLIFTFWKGGFVSKSFVERPLINHDHHYHKHHQQNWIKGSALLLISFIAWSVWLILQAMVLKVYPAGLSLNAIVCLVASIQSSLLAWFVGTHRSAWRLQWDIQLLTIIYCGVVISALACFVQTWCISKKGPVFAAMFSPLLLVIIGIFSVITFAERLHFGSLVGAFVIIVGLYCVLWGKQTDDLVLHDNNSNTDNKMLPNSLDPPTVTQQNQM